MATWQENAERAVSGWRMNLGSDSSQVTGYKGVVLEPKWNMNKLEDDS